MSNARGAGAGRRLVTGAMAGAVAGAAGTLAMDLLLYGRYRRGGGQEPLWRWESAEGVKSWEQASAPGQLGQKLEHLALGRTPPDRWARSTTNLVHWATGIGWGAQYGALGAISPRLPWARAISLGPAAWLSGYAILPLAGVYQPIWEYDAWTLVEDLSAHLVFGLATSSLFEALRRGRR